jgi:hypothetical protein
MVDLTVLLDGGRLSAIRIINTKPFRSFCIAWIRRNQVQLVEEDCDCNIEPPASPYAIISAASSSTASESSSSIVSKIDR